MKEENRAWNLMSSMFLDYEENLHVILGGKVENKRVDPWQTKMKTNT
jgi:hypothetical protein